MNCKLEKFWNKEKDKDLEVIYNMNCKLEKFWNIVKFGGGVTTEAMNCKLEKFWNFLVHQSWNITAYEL